MFGKFSYSWKKELQKIKRLIKEDVMKKDLISIGNCGEYFVAAELERHGFTVAVPMSNTPDFDILAVSKNDSNKQYLIQVKTQSGRIPSWTLNKKNETLEGHNIVYIFVTLNEYDIPDYYIVPSKVVAKTIKRTHQEWLDTPGKKGQKHNDGTMRKFRLTEDSEYKNAWNLL